MPDPTNEQAAAQDVEYAVFRSSLRHTKLVTPTGKSIAFKEHRFITIDQDCIAYLRKEIRSRSLPGIEEGEPELHSTDPMVELRRRITQEIREEEAKKAAELMQLRNFGNTTIPATNEEAKAVSGVGVVSTEKLRQIAVDAVAKK